MTKKIVWMIVSCLMALSLVIASCGPAEEEEEEAVVTGGGEEEEVIVEEEEEVVVSGPETPKYGGTVVLPVEKDSTRGHLLDLGKQPYIHLSFNRVWDGDWTKGPAGGYGTNDVSWGEFSTHRFDLKAGYIAESWEFVVDSEAKEVTTVVQVREGIHFQRVDSEAGRLVNGREVTVDDVVYCENEFLHNPLSFNLQMFPYIKEFEAVKTGPREFSITLPFYDHIGGIMRLFDNMVIYAPELQEKYGTGAQGASYWKNLVGTGPFIVSDVIPGNMSEVVRNPDYWYKDPIGPGKGNQLPYVDKVKSIIMTDLSTRLAAMRTGKIDRMINFSIEDKKEMLNRIPQLKFAQGGTGAMGAIGMKTGEAPFDDVRVRRAMMLAIDRDTINDTLYDGLGDRVSWPYYYEKAYADLYLGLDDPDCPESVRELFSYNPEKAKALMVEAGYPDGFKTTLKIDITQVDYYSIIADYFSKVNIDMSLSILEAGTIWDILANRAYEMISLNVSPPATWPEQFMFEGNSPINHSMINDPLANEAAETSRDLAVTDFSGAMKMTREITKHLLDQAYVIPSFRYPVYILWWPWIKNYSGERTVGYMNGDFWVQWAWLDQDLKESMGY